MFNPTTEQYNQLITYAKSIDYNNHEDIVHDAILKYSDFEECLKKLRSGKFYYITESFRDLRKFDPEKTCMKCNTIKPIMCFEEYRYKNTISTRNICKDCDNERERKWNFDNRERLNEMRRGYRLKNNDKYRLRDKKYREKYKEQIKEGNKKYKERNIEKVREWGRNNYHRNKDKRLEKIKEWQRNNPEKVKEYKKKSYEKQKLRKQKNRV